MCRQSKRCNAKMTAITTFVILFTFTFTYASVYPSRHSKNTAMMDNPRNFVSMSFEALASIAQSFSEWIALLASYCLTVSCCLLESFSVVLVTVWENTVVILSDLRMFILMIFETLASIRYWENICAMIQNIYWFIAKIFEALENVAHVCLKCIALLASYCHTVSSYLLEWLLFVLIRVWDNMVVILDNLRKFTSMIVETLTGIGYWENTCAILESLRWLISTIFEASIRFAHGCLEWIRFLASHCHTASCYLLELFSVVLVRVWDNMVVILDNLRKFTLMIVQTLTSIKYWENTCNVLENLRWLISKIFEASSSFAQVCFEWFTLIASYCHTASCYLLDLSLVILIRVWNNMVIILEQCGYYFGQSPHVHLDDH
ncbi:uncharacterized protein LOC111332131 [Stylophora pistillata]|uniref:uncharacterized protein LOC111332131 n=1 Tax=Stylophora pistillata TaxID=50429 RepID=UPI000C0537FF|nr:uncharacterized protein LOC111332131 [Stylophora pistillata]